MVFELPDTPVLLILTGIIFIFISIIGGKTIIANISIPEISLRQRYILSIFGAILFIIGILWIHIPSPNDNQNNASIILTPIPTPPLFYAEITNPKNGGEVPTGTLIIEGTFDGQLTAGQHLWLLLYDLEDWYPTNRIEPFNGKWDVKTNLGPAWAGKRGDIVLLWVDKDKDSEFKAGESVVVSLPEGTKILDRISVNVK